ncbi:MAG: TolC family protein [Fulvivirga sp.]|nr:TolC family protein [Fulvivirga sp.]
MYCKIYFIFIFLLAGIKVQAQEEGYINYSLEECIAYALEHNANLLNAQLDRKIAQKKVNETIADGLPQLNGNVDLGYNFKVRTTPIPDFISPAVYAVLQQESLVQNPPTEFGLIPVQFGTKYTGSATLSLEQMIFNGSYFVGLQAARTFTELSRKDQIKTKIDVIEAVSKAYYSTLVLEERKKLVVTNYQRLDSLLRDTRIMHENGFAEKIDVSRIQVQFNNIKVEKENFDKSLMISKALLKFQMGMPQETVLNLSDQISDINFEKIENSLGNDFTYEQRIEYAQLQTNKDLVELDIKNTRVKYYPRIDMYGTLGSTTGVQSSDEFFNFNDNWFGIGVVGLRMNLPIFDGFRKSNIIQQKKIQAEQIDNSFEQLKHNIDLEIKRASVQYERSIDNMVAQKENMQLAKEVYHVTKIKYEEGVGSNIEVTNADADYKEAQTNYYNALYEALIAKVELEKAYGRLLENQ